MQTGLWQWREPAFYVFFILMILSSLFHALLQLVFRQISGSGLALSWVLMLLYAVPVLLAVYYLDLYEREPKSLLFGALVWGGLVATGLAGIANDGWGVVVVELFGPNFAAQWSAALTAPFTEEILKAVGVVLIYLIARGEMDDIMDGFVYGAIVGLGFTVIEDILYFMAVFGGTVEAVLIGFFLRVVASGLYGHVLYTGLAGMGIAYFVSRRGEAGFGKRLGVATLLFGIAMFGHFLWNSPLLDFFPEYPWTGSEWALIPVATAVKGLPFLIFLLLMVRLARRRERRWLGLALETEVGGPAISSDELQILLDPKRRRKARRELKRRFGSKAASLLAQLQKAQVNLAMVRTRVFQDDHPDLVSQRALCRVLRTRLESIVGRSPAAPPPVPAA